MPLIPAVVAATVKRNAIRKGVFGSSTGWKAVAVVAFGGSLLRRLASKQADVLTVDKLEPGQSILVSTFPAPTRAQRKATKRDRRRSRRPAA